MDKFRDQIIQCIQYADSETLAKLLSVRKNPEIKILAASTSNITHVFHRLPSLWVQLIESYLKCLSPYFSSQWKPLFSVYKSMFNAFLRIFQTGDSSMLKLLYVMCDELWFFAKKVILILCLSNFMY